MIMAKNSNNNYVNIEDIEAKNNNEYQDIEKIVSKQGNLLYNKYKETEDTLPINFKGKGKNLKNYRIYGNTVGGESVGDLVTAGEHAGEYKVPVTVGGKNLWSGVVEQGSVSMAGNYGSNTKRIRSKNIPIEPGTYTVSANVLIRIIYAYNDDKKIGACIDVASGTYSSSFTVPAGTNNISVAMMKIVDNVEVDITPSDFIWGQIEKGSEATTYEPYHAPVTTPIYLPEQIRKVGDEAEYIDYAEQKQHRVRKNLFDKNSDMNTHGTVGSLSTQPLTYGFPGTINEQSGTYFMDVLPGEVYTISMETTGDRLSISGLYHSINPNDYTTSNRVIMDTIITVMITEENVPDTYTFTVPPNVVMVAIYYALKSMPTNFQIVKGSTALPYEPYIENVDLDVTLPALPTLEGTNTLTVGTAVQPSKVYLKGKLKRTIYGWHVNPDISNSSNAVTYLKDAIGMTPASMGSSTFNYGSWQNAFFMPKPCMLKSNGKVDYYLDPNDYTKKLDGTASDISNPNYDGNAMMQWPKIWFKYVKGVKEGQGYFYVANYKADGNYHCWCNYDSEDNEIDHFYTAIYNGTSFMNYSASKTYVVNDFAVYDNKLYKCNTAITTAQAFNSAKWDVVSNTAPAINKMRSLSGISLTNNNGNAQTNTTTEVTRAEANNTTAAKEWYIETFSDRLLINGLLVLIGKSLNTQAIFGRGLDSGLQSVKEAYITGALNDKGLFYGVTENGNSAVKVFGMENFWGCAWHRTAGLITNNHAIKLKLTYGTKDGSTVIGYNQTGNGYIDNGTSPYTNGYVQKMSYNKYGFMPTVVTGGSQSTYYADYHYQNENYTGVIYALFGGRSDYGLGAGAFYLGLSSGPGGASWSVAASLSCKPLL